MGYFPFYIDIKDKPCLVVGGGVVALRKIQKIIEFEADITVVAPEICGEIMQINKIKLLNRKFEDKDLDDKFFVISATDDESVNEHIFQLCQEKGILVNTVDDKDKCGFIFPALVSKNNVTVGISTSAQSPIFAAYLRREIDDMLDERYCKIADILGKYRPVINAAFNSEQTRKKACGSLLDMCLNSGRIPDKNEINDMLERMKNSYED